MPRQLHVANLSPTVDESDLAKLFATHGTVRCAQVLPSSRSAPESTAGRVEMASDAEAKVAIKKLNGQAYCGRLLAASWATPRQAASAGPDPQLGSMNMPSEWVEFMPLNLPSVPFRSQAAPADVGVLRTGAATSGLSDSQRSTYEGVFQHSVPRGLHWPKLRSMLGVLAEVLVNKDGAINAQRNGQTLALARPLKKIASVQEVMNIRRFLERCNERREDEH